MVRVKNSKIWCDIINITMKESL